MKKQQDIEETTKPETGNERQNPLDLLVIGQRDALEALRKLPDKCCDIFTDPPYNVGKDYGPVSDSMPEEDYKEWIAEVLTECKRVAVVFTLYVSQKYNLHYWNVLGDEFREIILPFRPEGSMRYGFINQYNKLLTNAKPGWKGYTKNVWDNMQQPGLGFFFREETYGYDGYTSEAITRRAIEKLSASDVIYDPFMGTGTTAVSAELAGKKWAGTDLNPIAINIAEKRIAEFRSQLRLAL